MDDPQFLSGISSPAVGESKDWINELPDCILSSILSLLRIKDAAQTSIVCQRWRNLWKTRPPNLELDIPNIFGSVCAPLVETHDLEELNHLRYTLEELCPRFERRCYIKRVKEVLELHSCNKLDSFKVAFYLDRTYTYLLDKWVRFAITKGAQKLDLHFFAGYPGHDNELYVFPHWILSDFNVSTLKHLSLYRCVLKPPADFDRFSQLTTLYLNHVEMEPDFMAHLFACSLLESLTLNNCTVSENLIIGPSVHLHDLKVLYCYPSERIEIDAVNLSSLEYGGHAEISFMRTPKLVNLFLILCGPGPLPNVLTQITSCPELSALHLRVGSYYQHIPPSLPTLSNLKQLKLDILWILNFELGSALNILRAAPLVEELLMTLHGADYQGDMRNLSTFSHNHLRRVKMQGFQGLWFEIELAISILKIATKLDEMVIDPLGSCYSGDGKSWEIECRDYDANEDENPPESIDDTSDDENVDNLPYELYRWQRRGRAAVQERLREVKTDAQVIIL